MSVMTFMFLFCFMGDSLTVGWQNTDLLPPNASIVGKVGGTIGTLESYLDKVIQTNPKKVFIIVGVNHIHDTNIIQKYQHLVEKIRTRLPDACVYVQSVLPTRRKDLNWRILQVNKQLRWMTHSMLDSKVMYVELHPYFCDDQGMLSKNFTTDGVHLTRNAYKLWRKLLDPYLSPDCYSSVSESISSKP